MKCPHCGKEVTKADLELEQYSDGEFAIDLTCIVCEYRSIRNLSANDFEERYE